MPKARWPRVNFRANGTAITFLQELHYYPFGMVMEGIGKAKVTDNAYQYNGKEWNEDLGLNWSDYGARWYDAALGRWWAVDLMAESSAFFSGYCYVMNNPLTMKDPTGMYAWSVGLEGGGAGDFWQSEQQEKGRQMQQQNESRKNYYVLIRSKAEIGEFYENTLANLGTFHIVISTTISGAESNVSKKLGKNKISTLVVDAHGAERGGIITTNANTNVGINGRHLEAYNSDGQSYAKYAPRNFEQIRSLSSVRL